MNRITIAGNSGAGKSTLAEKLSAQTGLQVYHLDLIQFRPGWQLAPENEFNQLHRRWLAKPRWIIEGVGPWPALIERFEAADTIIYLDFPVAYCLQNAQKRLAEDQIRPNPFVPENSPYAAKADKQETVIKFFYQEWRPKILKVIDQLAPGRNVYVLPNPDFLPTLLADLKP